MGHIIPTWDVFGPTIVGAVIVMKRAAGIMATQALATKKLHGDAHGTKSIAIATSQAAGTIPHKPLVRRNQRQAVIGMRPGTTVPSRAAGAMTTAPPAGRKLIVCGVIMDGVMT